MSITKKIKFEIEIEIKEIKVEVIEESKAEMPKATVPITPAPSPITQSK